MVENNYYDILGVKKNATTKEINNAYRRLTKKWHPDHCKDPSAEEKMIAINEAINVLRDPILRKNYDEQLELSGSSDKKDHGETPYNPQKTYKPKPQQSHSKKSYSKKTEPKKTGIPHKYILAIGIIFVICIAVIIGVILTKQGPFGAGAPVNISANTTSTLTSTGALYTKSVDLANAGNYQEALDAAGQALAMNVTSLTGLIQSNRAGILVMLHRDNEAITAADAALAVEGNLTAVHSIAWYNKGNALRALGRIAEAQDAYNHAYALDNTLVPPDMSADVPVAPVSTTIKSPS